MEHMVGIFRWKIDFQLSLYHIPDAVFCRMKCVISFPYSTVTSFFEFDFGVILTLSRPGPFSHEHITEKIRMFIELRGGKMVHVVGIGRWNIDF